MTESQDLPKKSGDVAPIVAVTVYPDRARVTRRQRVTLPAGEHRVRFDQLPAGLDEDSVRVAGGPGAGEMAGRGFTVTVLSVDVSWQYPARATDEVIVALRQQVVESRAHLAALDDEDAVAEQRLEFYTGLAHRSTRSYARALAAGSTSPDQVDQLADALTTQQETVRAGRRNLSERRERAQEELDARQRALDARQGRPRPDHRAVTVQLRVTADADAPDPVIELDLSYVVMGASWHSAYDVRLDTAGEAHRLALSWFGLVTQQTGEDWPEVDLRLSTARPSGAVTVPELDPWFLDRRRPVPPPAPAGMPATLGAAPMMSRAKAVAVDAMPVAFEAAVIEQGATAATYKPTRPVAVPSDGTAHRATVAAIELDATLDYITAPVRAAEAHLRAVVVNTSEHTLPAGRAAVFHAGEFVGSTRLEVWAPGEEVELALGIDDRVRVERELVRRGATKAFRGPAMLGAARRRDVEHRIRVTNHTPSRAKVTVLDQLPVSRDEGIVIKEQRLDPAPAERTDLGVLTWSLELAPGQTRDIHVGVRVETAKGVDVVGWRE